MQDDLQKAYSAYQQALYLLPNPKVNLVCYSPLSVLMSTQRRIPSYGMVSAYYMIGTGLWTMQKRRSLPSSRWTKVGSLPFPQVFPFIFIPQN